MNDAMFSVLVVQLEALVGSSSAAKTPAVDSLAHFDLLTKLLAAIKNEPKEQLTPSQRTCEDKLEKLLVAGARPPVRRLASEAMACLIQKGDNISVYARSGSLQGFLADNVDKKVDSASLIGVAQCLGALLKVFGKQLTSGLRETATIVSKFMKSSEVLVRQSGLQLLRDAMAGTSGGGSSAAHAEALKVVLKAGVVDKDPLVRGAAAGCLSAIAQAGGPGLQGGALEVAVMQSLRGLEDTDNSVGEAFASALANLLALGANPQKQVLPKLKSGVAPPAKALEGGLQKFLVVPFCKAAGARARELRVNIAMAWVAFLQSMVRLYGLNDLELPACGLQAVQTMGPVNGVKGSTLDVQAQACILYVVRVGVVEQMGEGPQREFIVQLIKQLSGATSCAPLLVVILRTVAHLLEVLGEVSLATREALDTALVSILSHPSEAVRIEVALTIRALALVDPECANGLMSVGVTMLRALRETIGVEKGDRLKAELDQLHGQAVVLAALLVVAPTLPLGVPSRFSADILAVARQMVIQPSKSTTASAASQNVGWMLIAALIAAMTEEEREEHVLDLLPLWAVPFGSRADRATKDKTQSLEFSAWAAAMEALAEFIRCCVVPVLEQPDYPNKAQLLQSVQQYLSSSFAYLAPLISQDSNAAAKAGAELLAIRTLEAYRAIPSGALAWGDHTALLAVCTSPFREAANLLSASCLRSLLHPADATLGPWVSGRDFLEDELRAFEGGADGLLPRVWASDMPVYPQPISQAVSLADAMLLSFGEATAAQSEKVKVQLLDTMLACLKAGRKARAPIVTNICVGLLAALKALIRAPNRRDSEPEFWKRVQLVIAGVLAADPLSPAIRRAVAEAEGLLARLMDDANAARLARSVITESTNVGQQKSARAAHALALGCIHRSVGGMALAALVPPTVQALSVLAKDTTDNLHLWALHALWLTADAAGLAYFPYVKDTLKLGMDVLLSEEQNTAAELRPVVARLANAMVAVLGPELSPGSNNFHRCQALVAYVAAEDTPAAQLECVRYAQQLILFAPQAVPAAAHVEQLRAMLTSRQPSLRRAAVATLRHLSERDPLAVVPQHIEEDLFNMLDSESDAAIIKDVRLTLDRLLEATCPSCPSRWLRLCRNVVLATSIPLLGAPVATGAGAGAPAEKDEEAGGQNDEEGFAVAAPATQPAAGRGEAKPGAASEHMPRYRTRVFAVDCLRQLPTAVGSNRAHFDLATAEEEREAAAMEGRATGDWLVLKLNEVVGLAFQIATGPMELLRPRGIELLHSLLLKFGHVQDPHFEGHLLLEQYQAQLVSAVRGAFEPGSGPLLLAAGAKLAAAVVTGGVAAGDKGLLQRILGLLEAPLSKLEGLSYPSYAEWVGCKVKVALLQAHAEVKCFAWQQEGSGSAESGDRVPVAAVLKPLLQPHGATLGQYWAGLLRDYAVLRTQPTALQAVYRPFLQDTHSTAALASIQPMLEQAWAVVLEAVSHDLGTREKPPQQTSTEADSRWAVTVTGREFDQLWGLAMFSLCEGGVKAGAAGRRASFVGPAVDVQGVALRALKCLSAAHLCRPEFLSVDLAHELVQALLDFDSQASAAASQAAAVLGLFEQLVSSIPEEQMAASTALHLAAAELGTFFLHRLLASTPSDPAALETATKAMAVLAKGLPTLVPFLLSSTLVDLEKLRGSVLASVCNLVESLVAAAAGTERHAEVVGGVVETVTRAFEQAMSEEAPEEERLSLLLSACMAVAAQGSAEPGLAAARARCLGCLQNALSRKSHPVVQMAALQALRKTLQASSQAPESSSSRQQAWTASVVQEAAPVVCETLYACSSQAGGSVLEASEVAVLGECLKVLVLVQQLAEGDAAQQAALHLLLASMLAVASLHQGLESMVVKLVTHLASAAPQFRVVVANLQPETKLQLQQLLRSSLAPAPAVAAPQAPQPLKVPLPSVGGGRLGLVLPPPAAGGMPSFAPPMKKPEPAVPAADDFDSDDDWGEPMSAAPLESEEGGVSTAPEDGVRADASAAVEDDVTAAEPREDERGVESRGGQVDGTGAAAEARPSDEAEGGVSAEEETVAEAEVGPAGNESKEPEAEQRAAEGGRAESKRPEAEGTAPERGLAGSKEPEAEGTAAAAGGLAGSKGPEAEGTAAAGGGLAGSKEPEAEGTEAERGLAESKEPESKDREEGSVVEAEGNLTEAKEGMEEGTLAAKDARMTEAENRGNGGVASQSGVEESSLPSEGMLVEAEGTETAVAETEAERKLPEAEDEGTEAEAMLGNPKEEETQLNGLTEDQDDSKQART